MNKSLTHMAPSAPSSHSPGTRPQHPASSSGENLQTKKAFTGSLPVMTSKLAAHPLRFGLKSEPPCQGVTGEFWRHPPSAAVLLDPWRCLMHFGLCPIPEILQYTAPLQLVAFNGFTSRYL